MQNYDRPDDEPLDPAVERVRRKMAKLQLVQLAIMFLGLAAVFAVIIYKVWYEPDENGDTVVDTSSVPGASSDALASQIDLTTQLPAGAKILQSSLSVDRLMIHWETSDKREIWVIALRSGDIESRVSLPR